MKGRLVAFVGVFCVAILMTSSVFAGKPVKTPKPDKPGRNKAECIIFTGEDLVSAGETSIVGCCPNAGPSPAYTMTLYLKDQGFRDDIAREGYVFMNSYGRNAPYEGYKFQFSTWDYETDNPGTGDYFIEIRGGVLDGGRKNDDKPFTVTFSNATATAWVYYDVLNPYCHPACDDPNCDPCLIVDPPCDLCSEPPCDNTCWIVDGPCHPCSDPCSDPCIIEIRIPNVSFVLLRDSDLSYCN